LIGNKAVSEEKGELLYRCDNFVNLDGWDSYTGRDIKFENGALLLGTSRDGVVLNKEMPSNLIIEFKARSLIWQKETFGCGFRVLLRFHENKKGKHDFYDIQFHPTPDVPNWGGYRHILVFKQIAEEEKNVMKGVLVRRWEEGKAGEWYDVRVVIEGDTIAVWMDGEAMLATTDKENSFPTGKVGLAGYRWGNYAYFKDLKIWALSKNDDE
jgi:hypothetical protein